MPPIQSIPTSPELNGTDEREQKMLVNGKIYLEVGREQERTAATQQVHPNGDVDLWCVVCA